MAQRILAVGMVALTLLCSSIGQTQQSGLEQANAELMSAVSSQDMVSVKAALRHGADVNMRSGRASSNVTPIMEAAEWSNEPIIRLLYRHGAKFGLQDDEGLTALSKAVMYANPSTVKLLIALGAEPSRVHRAALTGNFNEVMRLLPKGANVNVVNRNGCTPLLVAATSGNVDIVRFLLNRNARPDKSDNLGFTPLYQACRYGYAAIVKQLLSHQASAHLKPFRKDMSAFEVAKIYNHEDVLNILKSYNISD